MINQLDARLKFPNTTYNLTNPWGGQGGRIDTDSENTSDPDDYGGDGWWGNWGRDVWNNLDDILAVVLNRNNRASDNSSNTPAGTGAGKSDTGGTPWLWIGAGAFVLVLILVIVVIKK